MNHTQKKPQMIANIAILEGNIEKSKSVFTKINSLLEEAKIKCDTMTEELGNIDQCIRGARDISARLPETLATLSKAIQKLVQEKMDIWIRFNQVSHQIEAFKLTKKWETVIYRDSIRYLDIFKIALNEAEYHTLDREAGVSLVEMRKRLSVDVLNHIAGFLPYDIQFYLLERRYNPFNRIGKLYPTAIQALYERLINTEGILSSFELGQAETYRKYAVSAFRREDDRKPLLIGFVYMMKYNCPAHALRLMKELIILINPRKRYSAKTQY